MVHAPDRPVVRYRPGVLAALLAIVGAVCALVIDCTTVHHEDHHAAGAEHLAVAAVLDTLDLVVPGHPLPDHCLAGTAVADTGIVLPALSLLGALVVVLVAALDHPVRTPRGPPRTSPRYRPGRDILTHHCICRR
ncbi:hypothetical protein ACIA5E_04635 [Nocardia asteroides]|uniref:hypothetical protein n=1 Tax=Nocardia asteroides TaxID=1824 RepID=UPI003798C12A